MLSVVDQNEKEIAALKDEAEFLITDKRIYIEKRSKNTVSEKIIPISSVKSVEFEYARVPWYLLFVLLGIILIGVSIGLYAAGIIKIVFVLPFVPVGIFFMLFGGIKYVRSKYEHLIICAGNETFKIILVGLSITKIREIQHSIFLALDADKHIIIEKPAAPKTQTADEDALLEKLLKE